MSLCPTCSVRSVGVEGRPFCSCMIRDEAFRDWRLESKRRVGCAPAAAGMSDRKVCCATLVSGAQDTWVYQQARPSIHSVVERVVCERVRPGSWAMKAFQTLHATSLLGLLCVMPLRASQRSMFGKSCREHPFNRSDPAGVGMSWVGFAFHVFLPAHPVNTQTHTSLTMHD